LIKEEGLSELKLPKAGKSMSLLQAFCKSHPKLHLMVMEGQETMTEGRRKRRIAHFIIICSHNN
jgi:hypothetical protein